MFRNKKPAGPPPTRAELIAQYRTNAAAWLKRAQKSGRLEAETRAATMATAAGVLALSLQMDDLLEKLGLTTQEVPDPDAEEDDSSDS